jgi:hypothetical protein
VAPGGITVDRNGNVLFVDTAALSVSKYNLATTALTTVVAAGLVGPTALSLRPDGVVVVADPAASALYAVGCDALTPTCSDALQNGDEEDVDCGGTCPDRCGDIAADPIWFVFRDHKHYHRHHRL